MVKIRDSVTNFVGNIREIYLSKGHRTNQSPKILKSHVSPLGGSMLEVINKLEEPLVTSEYVGIQSVGRISSQCLFYLMPSRTKQHMNSTPPP